MPDVTPTGERVPYGRRVAAVPQTFESLLIESDEGGDSALSTPLDRARVMFVASYVVKRHCPLELGK